MCADTSACNALPLHPRPSAGPGSRQADCLCLPSLFQPLVTMLCADPGLYRASR